MLIRPLIGLVLALLIAASAHAQGVKISNLPAGTALVGTEVAPFVQDGDTVKITAEQIADYAQDGITSLATVSSIQGFTVDLDDAGADAFWGWDDSAAAYENLLKSEAQAILGLQSSTSDNQIVRYDSTAGNQQGSDWVLDDSGNLTSAETSISFSYSGQVGALTLGTTDPVTGRGAHVFDLGSTALGVLTVTNNSSGAFDGPGLHLYSNSSTPANGDLIGYINFQGEDSGGGADGYAYIHGYSSDVTAGSEDGQVEIGYKLNNVAETALLINTSMQNGVQGHVVSATAASFSGLEIRNANTSNGVGLSTYANSATPAALDVIQRIYAFGEDSAGNSQEYARTEVVLADVTSTSEDAIYVFNTVAGGTNADRAYFGQGLVVGTSATGGDKGNGTINVDTEIYKDNSAYGNPDYAIEHWATGKIEQFKDNDGAAGYMGLMPLDELESYMRTNFDLPGVKRRPEGVGIFERADISLEKIEEAYIYITQLHNRVKQLEARRCFGISLPIGCLGLSM